MESVKNLHRNAYLKKCLLWIVLFLVCSTDTVAFMPSKSQRNPTCRRTQKDSVDDIFLDDLAPPQLDFGRDSILFGENPSTQKNNNVLRLWRQTKSALPKVLTGAWKDSVGEENPVGAFYNMAFVRIPAIVAFFLYGKNELNGHPLVVDFGYGQSAMNPLVVIGFMVIFLGPFLNEK
uniref:Uncharacterized protein n=1 Tax=Corethron hystrix TaxID=216773 RepID=A0A7S1B9R2_9STRA|mmetsp:Transcript_18560/g.42434  ORF Transcript_18560/g.42434 Transcript_18560/m.42434 type:complete len:177 (+) Transcript_18560:78-608(+)